MNHLGIRKSQQGDLQGAIDDYDRALELKPDFADIARKRLRS
jgi:tetratricopeptide (TPR) repeat protein